MFAALGMDVGADTFDLSFHESPLSERSGQPGEARYNAPPELPVKERTLQQVIQQDDEPSREEIPGPPR